MAGEWTETTLGGVTEFMSGGTPSKERADYWDGSLPWVSAKDMKRFRLDDTEDHVTDEGLANGKKLVPAGTVLLLVRGMTLLNDLPICVTNRPMTFNQDVKALRPKRNVRHDFLPYLLLGHKERLLSLVDLAGHGTGRLNTDELNALKVSLPPDTEQRAIAHILGTLDDKIELNRRMNETLEAMARALFRSWFVHFDPVRARAKRRAPGLPNVLADLFPDSFEDSELGDLPKGWQVGSILVHARLVSGGTPKTDRPDYWDGPISWASAKDVSQSTGLFLIETERTITNRGLDESATQIVPALCSVVVARGATTGRMVLLGSEMAMNQTCYALGTTTETPFALYCRLSQEINALVRAAHGSIFDTITTSTFASSRVVLPPTNLLKAFEQRTSPLFQRVLKNERESRTLSALRDALLPKLISGEVSLKDTHIARAQP